MPLLTDLTIGNQQDIDEIKLQSISETKLQENVIAVNYIADLRSVRGLQVSCPGENLLKNWLSIFFL